MSSERGSALIGTLIIGFMIVLFIGQTLLTLGRLNAASADASEVAASAAQHGARYGDLDDAARYARHLLPDATVTVDTDGSTLRVEVRVPVPVVGPSGSPLQTTVIGRATSTMSPYRSRP